MYTLKYLVSAFFVLLACAAPAAWGQGRPAIPSVGHISGTVVDSDTERPIETATVALWSARDSSLVTGAVTDEAGRFDLEQLQGGRYYLTVSFIGYRSRTIDDINLSQTMRHADLGKVGLGPDTAMLEEVRVEAERGFMETRIDRTVYNTKDQLVAVGGSATDVLRNIPSVEVDVDGKVSLRGSQNVAVLLNGRPAQMNGDMLASFLQGLPASSIERIEVIPNPSARYEPDGMSGILNIVLKQDTDLGLSGGLTAGLGTQDNYNASGFLAYGKGKLGLRANYGFRNGSRNMEGDRFNEYRFREPSTFLESNNLGEHNSLSHMLNTNLDYQLDRRHSLSLSAMAGIRGADGDEFTDYSELDDALVLTNRYERLADEEGDDFNMDYALSFRRILDPTKHELTAEMRFERETEMEQENYLERVLVPQPATSPTDLARELQNVDQDERSTETSFQVDYLRPLGEKGKIEAGYKGALRRLDSEFISESYDFGLGQYRPDVDLNNTFLFNEQVHAAYGILASEMGRLGFQAGLRVEQAMTTFDLRTTQESYDNDYFSLFPSAFLTYKLSEKNQIKANYSKRINRPRTYALNPFRDQDDPLFQRVGNPYLRPEYIHSIEAGFVRTSKATTFTLSPYFRRTVDMIHYYQFMDTTGVTTLTFQNFDTSDSWGAESIGTLRFGRRLNAYGSLNVYRIQTDGSNVESDLSNDAYGWSTRINASYQVRPGLDVQASFFYRSPINIENGRMDAFSMSDLAFRQQLFGERASLGLRVSDVFNTMGFSMSRATDQYRLEMDRRWDSRQLHLTFTYNFGRQERNARRNRPEQERPDGGFDEMGF